MKRINGFNTLRLFAMALIVIYHISRISLPGGFIAVEIFFVLSGFLITGKLVKLYKDEKNKTSFLAFLWSRIKKFYPAMLACVILTLSIGYFTNPDMMTRVRENTLTALTFSTNIFDLIKGTSYESQIIPNVFQHFWFLALIMQAYVIIYVIVRLSMLSCKKAQNGMKLMTIVCGMLAVFSYALMAIIGGRYGLADRAYFGPDTHLGGFLLGATLAGVMELRSEKTKIWRHKWWGFAVIFPVSAIIVVLSLNFEYFAAEIYEWVLAVVAMMTALLIFIIVKMQGIKKIERSRIFALFEYLGGLAFYIYLIHWPIYVLCSSIAGMDQWVVILVTIVGSIAFAILMEEAILPLFARPKWWNIVILMLLLVLPVLTLIKAPDISSIEQQLEGEAMSEPIKEGISYDVDFGNTAKLVEVLSDRVVPYIDAAAENVAVPKPVVIPTWTYSSGVGILVIGDSVTLGAKSEIERMLPGVYVDAEGSRGIEMASPLISYYMSRGMSPNVIVISLITNYRNITAANWQNIIATGGADKSYILVTGYCGNAGCGDGRTSRIAQNNTIYDFAATHGNVYVADWYSLAADNPGAYFYSDNTHLAPNGRTAYAALISGVVNSL